MCCRCLAVWRAASPVIRVAGLGTDDQPRSYLDLPEAKLSRITKAVRNFSARQANAILGRTGQPFWQDESWDRWVRGPEELEKMVEYIEENPLAAGLVERVEDWRWSSAFGISG
jgi:hypothetical protein